LTSRSLATAVEPVGVSIDRRMMDADDRARLLRVADDCSLGERLLARLVIDEGLTLAQAIGVRGSDLFDAGVTVTTKTGTRESRALSPTAVELVRRAVRETEPDATLVTGRSGRPLSTPAARELLLALARMAGVPVRSVHQLRADHRVIAAT
jgi:integrase